MQLIFSDKQVDSLVEYFLDLAKGMVAAAIIQQMYIENILFVEKFFRVILGAMGSLLFLVIALRLRKED